MLKIDVESLQSGINSGLSRAKQLLQSARSSAASISAPNGFSRTAELKSIPSKISAVINSFEGIESAVVAVVNKFNEVEARNAHTVDALLMQSLYKGSDDFFSFSRAEALSNPTRMNIIVNKLEKTSPEAYNQVISNISAGCGVSAEEAKKIFKSITYNESYMNATYDIIDKCVKNPGKYEQVFGYPKLVGSDVIVEVPTYSNAMSLYMDLFIYSNFLSKNGKNLINISENGNVSINSGAKLQEINQDTISQFSKYMQYVNFARTAKARHTYIEDNNYSYWNDGEELPERPEDMVKIPKTVCSAYVYWVCTDAKYLSKDDPNYPNEEQKIYRCKDLVPKLKESGFSSIMNEGESREETISKLQPGDILCYGDHHIEIYAGGPNGSWNIHSVYNAGSTDYIQNEAPQDASRDIYTTDELTDILRVPDLKDLNL